ncbi:Acid phosphatase/vanadium-dependent haloperoxidase-related protein [Arabidopsis thaliana]|uniref:Acid phosphatase/vanadium-dependent haloperoxidase-related protein n=1 Tax=Arabidopsis thaliana TaxID=3702 RepID=F4I989_ARATH|nr:Acid phosphatase/vanadium-dependent haloperoxidase-related protein [Arabidopsis thaliana]AEE30521.1 Acid phosphatase/vanadium-dependent haloperoxidase-related protein [Arabidopsis thaliana]|eukprot:NP_001185084.1 Acid phosphatase/vanadium-dependent haloperoxidase-related protein [Arabidopsis thaliana]
MEDSTATATSSSSTHYFSIFTNYPLISAVTSFTIAQFIKLFTSWYRERRWDLKQLIGSGGMPSSHSATVTALAVAIGLQEGFGGSHFAIALILASVVMYDATGVRLHAGRQAEVLNQIVYELPAEHPLAESRPLRELLGHTPPQIVTELGEIMSTNRVLKESVVAGGMLGSATAVTGYLFFRIATS